MDAEGIYRILRSGSPEEREDFVLALPASVRQAEAVEGIGSDRPATVIAAMVPLITSYFFGNEPELGAKLAEATHRYAVEMQQEGRYDGQHIGTLSRMAESSRRAEAFPETAAPPPTSGAGGAEPRDAPPSLGRSPSPAPRRMGARGPSRPRGLVKKARKAVGPKPRSPTAKKGARGRLKTKARSAPRKTALEDTEVRREPHIDFHELVRAGETNELVVRLSDIIGPTAPGGTVTVAIPSGKKTVTLVVTLSAPGFDIAPKREKKLTVGRSFSARRERVAFRLTAREPGPKPVVKEIRADIKLGTSTLGAVIHYTKVVPKAWKKQESGDGRSRAEPFALIENRRDCDLVIRVEGRDDSGKPPFSIRLDSAIPGELYSSRYVGELRFPVGKLTKFMQDLFDQFTVQYQNLDPTDSKAVKGWRKKLVEAVEALGRDLWTRLPQQFRDEYFRLKDAGKLPKSIQVHSDEMLIPWELIIPHRNGKSLAPLGVAHVMGRWRPGLKIKPDPQQIPIQNGVIVNPKYAGAANPLWWSVIEAQDLKKMLPSLDVLPKADSDAVKKVVKRSDVQLFHYTGHGQFGRANADLSTLLLEHRDQFPAVSFVGAPFLAKGPILYLNACGVGSSGAVLGQMGGFAFKCMMGGCSGVIAPYWSVSDDSARKFALEFYRQLKDGTAIGEALKKVRAKHRKDPTFQAFAYFGDPFTKARFV